MVVISLGGSEYHRLDFEDAYRWIAIWIRTPETLLKQSDLITARSIYPEMVATVTYISPVDDIISVFSKAHLVKCECYMCSTAVNTMICANRMLTFDRVISILCIISVAPIPHSHGSFPRFTFSCACLTTYS